MIEFNKRYENQNLAEFRKLKTALHYELLPYLNYGNDIEDLDFYELAELCSSILPVEEE